MRVLATLALALSLAACSASGDSTTFEVTDLRLSQERDGTPVLSGVFVNLSDQPITSADIGVTVYNDEGFPFDDPVRLAVSRVDAGDSTRFRTRLDVPARRANLKYVMAN